MPDTDHSQNDGACCLIQPTSGWRHVNVRELWLFRELLYYFTWRDIAVRYKQTAIGILWAILQPLVSMVVFSVFFGHFAKVPSEDVPYPVFVYVGLLPWTFFSQALSRSSDSVVLNANIIRKIYFPRLIIPISASLAALVDFLFSISVLILLMVVYAFAPSIEGVLCFPILVLLTFFCALGIGCWLSALNVMYRDVRYAIPFFIQLGLFVTPVIYPASIVPSRYEMLLYLNPMTGIIETCRATLLGHRSVPLAGLCISLVTTLILFLAGVYFFRKMEREFADVI